MLPGNREANAATVAAGITAKEGRSGRAVRRAGRGLNCTAGRQIVSRTAGRTVSREAAESGGVRNSTVSSLSGQKAVLRSVLEMVIRQKGRPNRGAGRVMAHLLHDGSPAAISLWAIYCRPL